MTAATIWLVKSSNGVVLSLILWPTGREHENADNSEMMFPPKRYLLNIRFPLNSLIPPAPFFSSTSPPSSYEQPFPAEEQQPVTAGLYWTRKIHNLCAVQRDVDAALVLLDRLCLRGYQPDPLNLASIIHALCHANRFSEARRRFLLAIASGFVPDERTCNVLIARLLDSRDPDSTLRVLGCLFNIKPQFVPSLSNYNRLVDQFCRKMGVAVAHRLVVDMKSRGHSPNVVTYTTLIGGFCRIGNMGDIHKVFDEMAKSGVAPNPLTYSVLIGGVLRRRDLQYGKELMGKLWESMSNETVCSVKAAAFSNLIDSLCREGFFHEVFSIAEHMPRGSGLNEQFAYGHMIDALCRARRHHGASRIIYIMRKKGLMPSLISYNSIIHGLCKEGGCMRAYQLLEEGVEYGYLPSEFTYKVLVEALPRI